MNPLASELNAVLEGSVVSRVLSRLGKDLYFPKGIVSQSAEAGARAHRYNATIGMAVEDGEPMMLEVVHREAPGLSRKEMAAYAPTAGLPALRQRWLEFMVRKNPALKGQPVSLPVVVPGLTNGVALASELFLDPDDVVLMPDLFWGNYRLIMEVRRGARIQSFPLFDPSWGMNLEALSQALASHRSRRKVMLALNFPNNPSGYSPTRSEVQSLVRLLVAEASRGMDIVVLCDDAYHGLFFEDDVETQSAFAFLVDAHPNILAIKVDGATKEDYVWGFRLGFITYGFKGATVEQGEALVKKTMGSLRGTVSSSTGMGQHILLKAWNDPAYWTQKEEKRDLLFQRYSVVRSLVEDLEPRTEGVLESLPFNSGYFMTFRTHGVDAETLRLSLLDKGIGTISIGKDLLRIAYAGVDTHQLGDLYRAIFAEAMDLRNRA